MERRSLWTDLSSLYNSMRPPWAILGDFNETICIYEIDGGVCAWDYGNAEFKGCLENISVEDLRATGAHLTWWNSQDAHPIFKKLDQVLVNNFWISLFDSYSAHFGPMELSDHCTAILFTGLTLARIPKPFQFFNFILDLEGFNSTLRTTWDCQIVGDPIFVLAEKLRRAKQAICDLNKRMAIFLVMLPKLGSRFTKFKLHFPLNL